MNNARKPSRNGSTRNILRYEEYPEIAKRAKAERGEIHWRDETALVNTDVRGRGYAPKGQTPAAYPPGARQKLSMISTVTNKGNARWMIIDDVFNAEKLIKFLSALIKDAKAKIFLILDNLRVHHSKVVKAWLAERTDSIEIFYLPNYARPPLTAMMKRPRDGTAARASTAMISAALRRSNRHQDGLRSPRDDLWLGHAHRRCHGKTLIGLSCVCPVA